MLADTHTLSPPTGCSCTSQSCSGFRSQPGPAGPGTPPAPLCDEGDEAPAPQTPLVDGEERCHGPIGFPNRSAPIRRAVAFQGGIEEVVVALALQVRRFAGSGQLGILLVQPFIGLAQLFVCPAELLVGGGQLPGIGPDLRQRLLIFALLQVAVFPCTLQTCITSPPRRDRSRTGNSPPPARPEGTQRRRGVPENRPPGVSPAAAPSTLPSSAAPQRDSWRRPGKMKMSLKGSNGPHG